MIKEIEALNKKIDRLMTEKTKADAQKEVWEGRLKESLKAYTQEYGVDMSGKNLNEIKENLKVEIAKVESQTEKEYKQSLQIVSLIENGDIKGAWKLLGVDLDETAEESENSVVEEPKEETLQSASSVISELDDSSFFGEDSESEEEPLVVEEDKEVEVKKAFSSPFTFEDDEEDDFVIPTTREPEKKKEEAKSTGIEVEDDEDDFGSFGGFGDILKGSKFEV